MKYIKSIILAFIIFIIGFIAWQNMWLNELREKYDIDHLSDNSNQKKEIADKNNKYVKKKIENKRQNTKLLKERTKPISEEDSGESINYINHDDLAVEKKDHEVKSDHNITKSMSQNNNTLSITIENNNKPITLRNRVPRQPVKTVKDGVGSKSHPTSTRRQ